MLTPEQIIIIGIVASALTFVFRVLLTYANIHIGRFLANLLLVIVAGVLAVAWIKPTLPPFDINNIFGWVQAVFALAAPLIAFASLIYNALYDQVVVPLWSKFAKKPAPTLRA